jgi:hypothetical protein
LAFWQLRLDWDCVGTRERVVIATAGHLRQAQEICVWEKASVQIGVVNGQQIIPAGAVPDPLEGDRGSAVWNP